MHQQQQTEAEAAAEEKEKERKNKKVHVCMYVLFIPSFPNNRFRSGKHPKLKTKQSKAKQKKKEGEKERSGEEQKFSLFVTNKIRMFFFVFFLVLYFI